MGSYNNDICETIESIMNENGKIIINTETDGFNINMCTKLEDYSYRDNCFKLYGSDCSLEIEIDLDECQTDYDEIEDEFYFICKNGTTIVLQPML